VTITGRPEYHSPELSESINPVLTKELIYTGITRAKESLKLLTSKAVFLETIQRRVDRYSGLAERIKKIGFRKSGS
jgi:exodeoxyribonuclease V alpha subunit